MDILRANHNRVARKKDMVMTPDDPWQMVVVLAVVMAMVLVMFPLWTTVAMSVANSCRKR